jgi:hypothetical protein
VSINEPAAVQCLRRHIAGSAHLGHDDRIFTRTFEQRDYLTDRLVIRVVLAERGQRSNFRYAPRHRTQNQEAGDRRDGPLHIAHKRPLPPLSSARKLV